jgi:hypothetical protein
MNKKYLLGIIILSALVILIVVIYPWLDTQYQIDKCLDSGGHWNYEKKECECEVLGGFLYKTSRCEPLKAKQCLEDGGTWNYNKEICE